MAILRLRVPEVKDQAEGRPEGCSRCGSQILQGWGVVTKPVRDTSGRRTITIRRYRCATCGRTFRHYPAGISRSEQTARLQVTAAMMWALGLSLRSATAFLGLFGAGICHQTVWNDGVKLGQQVAQRRPRGRVRVLGVDGTGARIGGKSSGVVVAVDMGSGLPVAFVELDERNPDALRQWLAPLVEKLGVEVIVSDDLASYGPAVKGVQTEHGACLFHTKRWVGRTLSELAEELDEDWLPTLEDVQTLMDELPSDGGYRLFEAWQQIHEPPPQPGDTATPEHRLRRLLIRLSNHWQRILLHQRRPDVPSTNNCTEQGIGRYKIRVKTMRGVKSALGREAIFYLTHARLLA